MYIAKFQVEKKEPKKLYFNATNGEPKRIQFQAEKKEPIKFKISDNFKMSVE